MSPEYAGALGLARRGARRLRQGLGRHLRRLSGPPALILLYHRVAQPAVDPWGIAVSPEHFAQHLDVLRRLARPVTLQGVLAGKGARVALTFDDGYADNLHAALPLLERSGVPATIFVVSGALEQARPFWWDELALLLLGSHPVPEHLELTLGEGEYVGQLETQVPGTLALPAPWQRWRAEAGPGGGPRERLYLELYWRLRALRAPEREDALHALRGWAGMGQHGESELGPHHRPLTGEELARLAAHPLIEIGAHTVTHPPLADLGREAQRGEIMGSKAQLEEVLGQPVTGFSLPHGSSNEHTASLVREAGFGRACTSVSGAVRRNTSPLALPRFNVEDWNGEQFEARLRRHLTG